MPTIITEPQAEAFLASVPNDDRTAGGLYLPHFGNSGRIDIARLRASFLIIEALLGTAIDEDSVRSIVAAAFAKFVGSAPEALDTVYELAAAFGNNPDVIAELLAQIGAKASNTDLTALGTVLDGRLDAVEAPGWVTFARLAGALVATAAEIRAATTDKLITPANENAANAVYDVPFATTMTIDGNNGRVQRITATANFTLALPQNLRNGRYELEVVSSGALRTMSFATGWRFAKGKLATLTQIIGAKDVFLIRPDGSTPAIVPTAFLDLKAPV